MPSWSVMCSCTYVCMLRHGGSGNNCIRKMRGMRECDAWGRYLSETEGPGRFGQGDFRQSRSRLWSTSGVGDKAARGAEREKRGTHTEGNPTRTAQVLQSAHLALGTGVAQGRGYMLGGGAVDVLPWPRCWSRIIPRLHFGFFAFCQLLRTTTHAHTHAHPHFLARMTNLEADNLHETFCAKRLSASNPS